MAETFTYSNLRAAVNVSLRSTLKGLLTSFFLAWVPGGSDFQVRFDKSTGQAHEMKEGALRVL